MIIVKIIGGLGNQLFQYALGRNLSVKKNTELKLDISGFEYYRLHKYGLDHFNIIENIATKEDIQKFRPAKRQFLSSYSSTILNCVLPWYKQKCIFEQGFLFNPEIYKIPQDAYLIGYWQSEKYFIDIKEIIKNEFTVKNNPDKINQEVLKIIHNTHSVSLHIRRQDYISDKKTMEIHGILEINYYSHALDLIQEKVKDPNIFVFSDDINWARENLKTELPLFFIDHNGTEKNYEDLRLMSSCQHNIIANSSFSWLAAWLNINPKKIIYAPKKWFNVQNLDARDLIPSSWFVI